MQLQCLKRFDLIGIYFITVMWSSSIQAKVKGDNGQYLTTWTLTPLI